jgi:hypothetical protein
MVIEAKLEVLKLLGSLIVNLCLVEFLYNAKQAQLMVASC